MKAAVATSILLGLISVAQSQDRKPIDEEKAIRQILDDQVAAWNKGDLAGFMKGYWNSEKLTFYSGKNKRQGWKETMERYKSLSG